MRNLFLVLVLFVLSINLSAQNELQIIRNKLLNETIIFNDDIRWSFEKDDTLRFRILEVKNYYSKKLKQKVDEYLIDFETYSNENFNWKSAIGRIVLSVTEKEESTFEVKSLNTYFLTEMQYNDIKLSEKLWKIFYTALINDDKDKVLNCFYFPLETYGSKIFDKSQFLRNYGGYFFRMKNLINSTSYLSLPEITDGNQESGECVFSASQLNEGDEENPQITITLRARKIDGVYLFYILEYGS